MKKVELTIKGATCGHCKLEIEKSLTDLIAVQSAVVNLKDKLVKISYDNSVLDLGILEGAIREVGYELGQISLKSEIKNNSTKTINS